MSFGNLRRLFRPGRCSPRFQNVRSFAKVADGLPDDRDTPNQQTQVNMLSADDDGCNYIHEYNDAGFTLRSGMKVFGPAVFFPRSFFSWKAMATFNFLNKEQRWVAAAIIPPQFIFTNTQQDIQEYFAERKREANLAIEDDGDDTEYIGEGKDQAVNMFGYPVYKSPLEPSIDELIGAVKKGAREAREKEIEDKKAKKNLKKDNDNEDPWADDDDDDVKKR